MRNVTVDTDVPHGHIDTVSGYTKLFSHIVHSTIWREPDHVRIVWVTMLALKDSHGDVMASVPGLADAARVTEEQCDDALKRLTAPDPRSRSKDLDGRRLVEIDGGWHCVNHDKYKRMMSIEDRRERDRERKRLERVRGTSEKSPNSNIQIRSDQIRSDPLDSRAAEPAPLRTGRKRKSPMPEGWAPARTPAIIELERGLDVKTELAQFRDRAMRDGATYLDWNAAWRTWLRNARKWAKPGSIGYQPKPLSVTDSKLVFTKRERLP